MSQDYRTFESYISLDELARLRADSASLARLEKLIDSHSSIRFESTDLYVLIHLVADDRTSVFAGKTLRAAIDAAEEK